MISCHLCFLAGPSARGRERAAGRLIVLASSANSWPLSSPRALLPLLVTWPDACPLHRQGTGQHCEMMGATHRLILGWKHVQSCEGRHYIRPQVPAKKKGHRCYPGTSKTWYSFWIQAFACLVCCCLLFSDLLMLVQAKGRSKSLCKSKGFS